MKNDQLGPIARAARGSTNLTKPKEPVGEPKVFAYCRYSGVGQHETSIERQIEMITMYAKNRGLVITEIFVDRATTGVGHVRSQLNAVWDACRRNPNSILIVESVDRAFRSNISYAHAEIKFHEFGVELHDMSGPISKLMKPILAAIAAEDRDKIVYRLTVGRNQRLRKGAWMYPTPYGYTRKSTGIIVPDPVKVPIVLELFQRRAAGATLGSLVTYLNRRGIAPPGAKSKRWYRSTLKKMFVSPIYAGVTVHNIDGENNW